MILFFHAVYHPYAVIYGNYSSLVMPPYDELWPAEFARPSPSALGSEVLAAVLPEQARTFVWGQQPTLANFRPALLEQRAEEIDYIARLARVRSRSIKYLLHGEFLRPPELSVPQVTADFSRLSIYAGQKSRLTSSRKSIPLALAGAWRAADGDVALALASLPMKRSRCPSRSTGSIMAFHNNRASTASTSAAESRSSCQSARAVGSN